jgi:ribosomal protein L11 methyltransferase
VWQVSILTTAEAEDAVAALLERELNVPASIYRDEETDSRTVSVYPVKFAGTVPFLRTRLRGQLRELKNFGLNFRPGRITVKRLRRENWAESWKRHFKPLEIGNALLIKPGWSRRRPKRGQRVVVLDPGLSFGTGHHPTTLFCLQRLAHCREPEKKQSLLDVGTGSGILAISAAKLGYSPVEAFDFDPVAVRISRENASKNRVKHRVWPQKKDLIKLKSARKYDVICANLAPDLLIQEASQLCARLNPGGRLIVAGILRRQFGSVQKTLQRFNLTMQVGIADKTWRSGQFVLY